MLTDSNQSVQEKWHRAGLRATALEGRIWVIFDDSDENSGQQRNGKSPSIVSLVGAFGPGTMIMAR
jgi:hypothetical protein